MRKGKVEELKEKGAAGAHEERGAVGPETTADSTERSESEQGPEPGGQSAIDVDRLRDECRASEEKAVAAEQALRAEQERAVRLQADFDNFRRRARQEQSELAERALDPFIKDLLPVVDNLDRAVTAAHASDASSGEALLQGVEMVQRQLLEVLASQGVEPMVTVGQPFDPHKHEAIQRVDEGDYARDTVIEEWQKGYERHGRVLRIAMVKVAASGGGDDGDVPGVV